MKLRERLQKSNLVSNMSTEGQSKDRGEFTLADVFVDSKEVRKYIIDLAQSRRNMIIISTKSFDKLIIADYIKSQLRKQNARMISDIDSRMEDLNGRINIIPNPDIHTIVKLLEQITYGCQSFIFGLSLGTYNNVINKLRALIALNFKNLTTVDITTLIGASNAAVVYISKNEDGLFFISQIDEINTTDSDTELELKTLFSNEEIRGKKEQTKADENEEEEKVVIAPQVSLEEEKPEEEETVEEPKKPVLEEGEEASLKYMIEEAQYEANEKEKKLNKYQMLRERAKQKKQEEEN